MNRLDNDPRLPIPGSIEYPQRLSARLHEILRKTAQIINGRVAQLADLTTAGILTINSSGSVASVSDINITGRVQAANQPSFHATSSNAPTTGTQWVFNSVTFNRGNNYNASTGNFTAPVTGVYYFYVFGLNANADTSDTRISLRVNGSVYSGDRFIMTKSTAKWETIYGMSVMSLTAGDYVSPWIEAAGAAFYTDGNYNGFGGYLVS